MTTFKTSSPLSKPIDLFEAAQTGNLEAVNACLRNDNDINAKRRYIPTLIISCGNTALIDAVDENYLEIVDALIKAGADVNLSNS